MKTRIYLVEDRSSGDKRLVEAASRSQAIRHATQGRFCASVPTTREFIDLTKKDGITVELVDDDGGE